MSASTGFRRLSIAFIVVVALAPPMAAAEPAPLSSGPARSPILCTCTGGWDADRVALGDRLPASHRARDYWMEDFKAFGLKAPEQGQAWLRYGDDALLVDVVSGEVRQLACGLFE